MAWLPRNFPKNIWTPLLGNTMWFETMTTWSKPLHQRLGLSRIGSLRIWCKQYQVISTNSDPVYNYLSLNRLVNMACRILLLCSLKLCQFILYAVRHKNKPPWQCFVVVIYRLILMMTSSIGNIFRVTGPLWGEFTGPGEFPAQRPVTRSFDVFFDLRLNKRLSKQPWGWCFETPSWPLWRQCNASI